VWGVCVAGVAMLEVVDVSNSCIIQKTQKIFAQTGRKQEHKENKLEIDNMSFESVQSFKYLQVSWINC